MPRELGQPHAAGRAFIVGAEDPRACPCTSERAVIAALLIGITLTAFGIVVNRSAPAGGR